MQHRQYPRLKQLLVSKESNVWQVLAEAFSVDFPIYHGDDIRFDGTNICLSITLYGIKLSSENGKMLYLELPLG